MLNALRHQWNHHPAVLFSLSHLRNVLNALRHQWNHHHTRSFFEAWAATSGAQRLAASMESSHLAADVLRLTAPCSTPCGINGIITPEPGAGPGRALRVLNALRHQWNHHLDGVPGRVWQGVCSTPCGINGIITVQGWLRGRREGLVPQPS